MAYDMVTPGPSVRRCLRGSKGKKRRYKQPADIREGMANALMLVKEVSPSLEFLHLPIDKKCLITGKSATPT